MAGDNKQIFDPTTRLPELTQNVIRSFHGHSKPPLKISCKSVQPFSRNVADKETKKSPEDNTPSPYRGGLKIQKVLSAILVPGYLTGIRVKGIETA